MDFKAFEVSGLNFIGDQLLAHESEAETALHPLEVELVEGGLKLTQESFSKLPPLIAGAVNAGFAHYSPVIEAAAEGALNKYVGVGFAYAANFFKDAAAHVAAS